MESGLREAPLPQPERILAGQEPIAEAVSQSIVERALVIVAGVVLQHMLDVRRIRQQKSMIRAGLEMNEVAVFIRSAEKRADRIGTELGQDAKDGIPTRSGRICARI